MSLSFTIVAEPRQRSLPQVRFPATRDHILLSDILDSPKLEVQVTAFISPRNRVSLFYTQALGSHFVASYDSQGYGGGIRPRLHTGVIPLSPSLQF
jgi:hypothetical protein